MIKNNGLALSYRLSCPNSCHWRGICKNPHEDGGYCSCYLGFTGDDCSVNLDDGMIEETTEVQTEAAAAEIRAIMRVGEIDEGTAVAVVTETATIMTIKNTCVAIENTVVETVSETAPKIAGGFRDQNASDIAVDTAAVSALDTTDNASTSTVGEDSVVIAGNATVEIQNLYISRTPIQYQDFQIAEDSSLSYNNEEV